MSSSNDLIKYFSKKVKKISTIKKLQVLSTSNAELYY